MMHVVTVDGQQSLVWSEVADPRPVAGEIVIDVHASAVNRADLLQRAGQYPAPPGWPEWMGLECAGLVRAAPAGSRWRVGDRVCALLGGGGYAEQVAVPESLVLPAPAGLSLLEAAALPEVFATAYLNLCLEAGLRAGEHVLIQAGASGVGTAAIQLVKLLGGTVVTTVGSAAKARLVRDLGADIVINHREQDLGDELAARPVDIALDCVGGAEVGGYLTTMKPGGRWVVIATLGGNQAALDLGRFYRLGLRLIGSTLRGRPLETKAEVLAGLERQVWPAIEAGRVRPVVHGTVPMAEAAAAHAILERRENIGKVVLATAAGLEGGR